MSKIINNELSQQVFEETYAKNGETVEEMFSRVAEKLAEVEGVKSQIVAEGFRELLKDFKFVPGGRILSNAGLELKGTTFINCFVDGFQGPAKDSMEGIMSALRRQSLILKSEGGYGFCADVMRPKGGFISGIANESPGAVRMLDMWDTQSAVITAGSGKKSKNKHAKGKIRKGAQMVTMSIWHPDIEEFIRAKQEPGRLTKFNMSVLITDEFMEAVEKNKPWNLEFPDHLDNKDAYNEYWDGNLAKWKSEGRPVVVYKTFEDANELWDIIMESTYTRNEPGVLFVDTINKMNNLKYVEHITATNPCLHPDTLIETTEGRLRIADIKNPVKVYTSLPDGSLGVAQASSSWISKKNASVWRITTRNGKEIKVTRDHRILTHNNGWVKAEDLKLGDQIVQLCRARRGAEYSGVKLTTEHNRSYKMEHRMIAESEYGDLGDQIVHHINGDTYDNHIDNLEVMSAEDHNRLTASTTHPQSHQLHSDNGRFVSTGKSPKRITPMPGYLKSNMKNDKSNAVIEIIKDFETTDVYDLAVEGTHNMIGNFMVVHNCGEQMLPVGGVCLLGSFNLTQFVNENRTGWDYDKLSKWIPIAVRFLDNVNDTTYVPLPSQEKNLKNKRRVGMGIMGLGSALMMMKIPYGSNVAVTLTERLMSFIANTAYQSSANLAKEKGAFPLFDADEYMKSPFIQNLSDATQSLIKEYGLRNSHLLSIQPTGNTSTLANVVSSGLEPIFMPEYIRTAIVPHDPEGMERPKQIDFIAGTAVDMGDWSWTKEGDENILTCQFDGHTYKIDSNRGLTKEHLVMDYAVRDLKERGEYDPEAEWHTTTLTLGIDEHVDMMEVMSRYIDSAMSKTVNLPADYPFEDFKELYTKLHATGTIKGGTTYRDGTMTAVLSAVKEDSPSGIRKTTAPKRPESLPCDIYHTTVKGVQWIVIVGLLEGDPYEVFAFKQTNLVLPKSIKSGELKKIKRNHYDMIDVESGLTMSDIGKHFDRDEEEALTRMISTALRHGAKIKFIVEQLNKSEGTVSSFSKAIARTLKKYIPEGDAIKVSCEACGSENVVMEDGCYKCLDCGSSKCS